MMNTTVNEANYTERDYALGVPAVEAVINLTPDQRREMTIDMATYLLEACAPEGVFRAAEHVEQLYARSATRCARFDIEHVDVFARSAIFALAEYDIHDSTKARDAIEHTRRIVGDQKHKHLLPLDSSH